jgi:Putative transposase of IS4/5 family (DUF4096)
MHLLEPVSRPAFTQFTSTGFSEHSSSRLYFPKLDSFGSLTMHPDGPRLRLVSCECGKRVGRRRDPPRITQEASCPRIAPLLPHRTHHGLAGHRFNDPRPIVNGILWILHTGAPWRDLPERSVFDAFSKRLRNAPRSSCLVCLLSLVSIPRRQKLVTFR